MVRHAKTGDTCTRCSSKMPFDSSDAVIVIPSLKFYKSWRDDRGNPTHRTKHKWCYQCVHTFFEWYVKRGVGEFSESTYEVS
jgi:hypothetical protein